MIFLLYIFSSPVYTVFFLSFCHSLFSSILKEAFIPSLTKQTSSCSCNPESAGTLSSDVYFITRQNKRLKWSSVSTLYGAPCSVIVKLLLFVSLTFHLDSDFILFSSTKLSTSYLPFTSSNFFIWFFAADNCYLLFSKLFKYLFMWKISDYRR